MTWSLLFYCITCVQINTNLDMSEFRYERVVLQYLECRFQLQLRVRVGKVSGEMVCKFDVRGPAGN